MSLLEDISHWQVVSDRSVSLCGRDFSDGNISPADGPSPKKSLCIEYIIPAVSQAACLGHIRGRSVVTDMHKNSFDKEEIMHWLTITLNYTAETKQALTRVMSEAPTKYIFSVKTIPASHWEFLFDKHCLQTNGSDLEATGKTAQTKGEEKHHHEGENLALKRRWQRLSWEKVGGGRKREQ